MKGFVRSIIDRGVNRLADAVAERIAKRVPQQVSRTTQPLVFGPYDTHVFVHSADGHRVFLDARDHHITLHVLEHGCWEEHVRAVIMRTLKPGSTFVDVGANVGLHSLFAASIVGPQGRVHAFEPVPRLFETLRLNMDINGLNAIVKAHPVAVSERTGTAEFAHFVSHAAMSGFAVPEERLAYFNGTASTNGSSSVNSMTVDTVALDEFLHDAKIDVMKMDVEGFETLVLRGARRIVHDNANIVLILEWDAQLIGRAMGTIALQESVDYLRGEEFIPYIASQGNGLERISWDSSRLYVDTMVDLVVSRTEIK